MAEQHEKALVPQIRFTGFTDPWEQRKLGELVEIERGGSPRPIEQYITDDPCGLNWVKIGDAPELGRYITKTAEKIKPEGLSKTRQVYPGDLVLSNSMSFGRPYIMAIKGCVHDGWLLIRDAQKHFDPIFLCHMLGAPQMLNQYRMFAAGSTVNNLNKELVGNAIVSLPSKNEQHEIGIALDRLDSLITLHQGKYDKLCVLKKSMLDKMFPKGGSLYSEIRFAGFTDPWEQRKLGKVGITYSGLHGKTKDDFGHGDAFFVPYTNVFDNPVTDQGRLEHVEVDSSQAEVKHGDVFFTVSSETPEEVGMSSIWLGNIRNVYLNSFCFGYRQDGSFDSLYLAYVLRSQSVRKQIELLAQGISRFNISKNKVMNVEVPKPSLGEQRRIGAFLDRLDSLITLHQRKYCGVASWMLGVALVRLSSEK